MLWITEGFVLDEAGNLITTSYIDLRSPGDRKAIRTLVKGCRREHALEDSKTILISPVQRFRREGENLIRDKQEGLAKVETVEPLPPAEVFKRRRLADLDEAVDLLSSELRVTHRLTSVSRSSENLTFGKEWWIFSTSIMPETEKEWTAWKATLDPAYDHVSKIGQSAKFAEALGRMVTEQLGPQGKEGWMQGSIGGRESVRTKHPTQWVVHGPVVYTDRLYDTLTEDADEATRIATSIFTKPATHAAQREYRFAILRDGAVDEKAFLTISGMIHDALQPGTSPLMRPVPEPVATTANEESGIPSQTNRSTKLLCQRGTERKTHREARRSEARGADGKILFSESTERESAHERTVTWGPDAEEKYIDATDNDSWGRRRQQSDSVTPDLGTTDEDAIKEIASADSASSAGDTEGEAITGCIFKSLEKTLRKLVDDPTFPMGGSSEPWAEKALSREEVLSIYRMISTLAHKVTRVAVEKREAASSACWQAIQCVRNIYVRLGDIVDTVSIERERFVVLGIKASDESKPPGRIVVAPSGAYAYSLKRSGKWTVGYSEGELGKIFFPVGSQLEAFESFGWPPKDSESTTEAEHQ